MSATPALPPGYNFLQTLWRMFRHSNNQLGMMQESMMQYDGTYSANIGSIRMIVTEDPAFIEYVLKGNQRNYHKSPIVSKQLGRFVGNGLLTSNGEYWLKQRRLIQPGFHNEKIHGLFSIIQKTVDDFLIHFPAGKNTDVYPQMNKLTFEIVINSLFNVHIPEEKRDELSDFITEVQDFVLKDVRQPYKSWWFRLSGEEKKNLDRSKRAREIIGELIQERKQSPDKFNDLLDMLLDARYEDNGKPMSEDQVIDEILIMLIAGHETSANALSFALFLLAKHPAELHKLQNSTTGLSLEETVKNEALLSVINETMRLYPPAWISDRVSLADDKFQDFEIPKGTTMVLFYYGLHRNPEYFTDPLSFHPDRFLKKNMDKEKQKAFYPFGAGPRMCIGNNFALAEMAIFLQAFITRFELKATAQTPALKPLITLRPDRVILDVVRK